MPPSALDQLSKYFLYKYGKPEMGMGFSLSSESV